MTPSPINAPAERLFGWTVAGLLVAVGMLGGMVAWAATTVIDGAVIAPGTIEVESKRKNVQHLEGGIVASVLVKEGASVQAGDVLVRLDATSARSELTTVQDRLTGLAVRQARLRAELVGATKIAFPVLLTARSGEPKIAEILSDEKRLFNSRSGARLANAELLARRIDSLDAQIDGQRRDKISSGGELELLTEALTKLDSLLERKLVQADRVLDVRRDISTVHSNMSANDAQINSLIAQVAEIQAQLRQAEASLNSATSEELAETQSEIQVLGERKIVLMDRLARADIIATQSGRILNLAFNAKGAVIAPGEVAMEIVPVDDRLILLAQIPASDVERVQLGQQANVRLTAFNQNSTPELIGRVESISADALIQPETGRSYFNARVALEDDMGDIDLNGQKLVPGMPAEILVSTGERLAASYFLRPLGDAYARTFRDE